jgi:TolC family type I secretion outer membrane protein
MTLLRTAALAGVTIAAGLAAGPALAQTLEEALVSAYQSNPTIGAQRAQARQVDEQVAQAISGWRPTVELFGEISAETRNFNSIGTQDSVPRAIGARIVQPVFRGGQTIAGVRAAENAVRAERARLLAVEQSVLLSAVVAYINVLAADAVLDFEVQNEQRLARFFEATRDRFEVGEVTRTDVFQAEARLARATADRVQREGDVEVARAEYRRVIGSSPQSLTLPPVPKELPAAVDAAVALASDNNPQILAAEYTEKANRDRVDQARGALLPELNLVGEAAKRYEISGLETDSDDARATLNLTVPLYQSGAEYSRLREAKQATAEARQVVDDARRQAIRSATQAWNELAASRARVKAFTTEVKANEVAVEGVEREQAVGTRTVLDVLDTQQDLIDSQRNLVIAKRDEIRFAYQVREATGTLTAEQLRLPVQYYDPSRHYDEVRGKWFGGSSSGDMNDRPPAAAGTK